MYKYLLLCSAAFLFACNSNDPDKHDEAALKEKLPTTLVSNPRSLSDSSKAGTLGKLNFTDTLHDFGTLNEGEVVQYEFAFTNQGKSDLLITEAKASCGCTVADYPDRPFKPGESEKIKVSFDSKGKPGMNEKTVSVITNGDPAVYNLLIRAQVIQK